MIGQLFLLIRTVRYLKFKQIAYRLYYVLRSRYRSFVGFSYKYNLYRKGKPLSFGPIIPSNNSYQSNTFTFLNQSVSFSNGIDWDYMENGKLWAYNLNYFDFLNQKNMTAEVGSAIMFLFIDKLQSLENAIEPYPSSLRGMNWVKFLSINNIERKSFDRFLFGQYRILLDNIEYHLLGNHLLENGCSLLFGGYYFNGKELYEKGKEIITEELAEQILKDGAHFELSPMYHKIILNRVLDCLNLVQNNKDVYADDAFEALLESSSKRMLGWLSTVTFVDGNTPRVNDSTEGISATSEELFAYAKRLNLSWEATDLSDSGYRVFKNEAVELFVDYGAIGPDYIPGHAHADTFSFVVNNEGKPLIVDPGISTYDIGYNRQKERSTSSHNTVSYGTLDQSEVWGGFRVGRRAEAVILEEQSNYIKGFHKGYKRFGIYHQRSFELGEKTIEIRDIVYPNDRIRGGSKAYFHFHPDHKVEIKDGVVKLDGCSIKFKGSLGVNLQEYNYAVGYNHLVKAQMIGVEFKGSLTTLIELS